MPFYAQEFKHLHIEVKNNHQLWITLNNPEQSNAISLEMTSSLITVLKHADFDDKVKVIVLTGSGKNFCAGGDVKAMRDKTGMFAGESNELRMRYMHGIQQIPICIESLSKPVVGMINGAAVGAGCDLAMMCDLRVGSHSTKFAETFTKLGLVPGDGGTFFLTRVVGYAKAMQMFMTGDFVEGEAAFYYGLLNYCVSDVDLLAKTSEIAEKIASNAPIAIQMTKKAMKQAYLNDLHSNLDLLASFQGITQRTQDHFEAISAMELKRKAQFKGV